MGNFRPPMTYSLLDCPEMALAALAAMSCCPWIFPATSLPILADLPGIEVGLEDRLLMPAGGAGVRFSQAARNGTRANTPRIRCFGVMGKFRLHAPMNVIHVKSLSDPRLAPYANMRDAELAQRADPLDGAAHGGLFIAEGELVLRRLLASRFAVQSVLTTPTR